MRSEFSDMNRHQESDGAGSGWSPAFTGKASAEPVDLMLGGDESYGLGGDYLCRPIDRPEGLVARLGRSRGDRPVERLAALARLQAAKPGTRLGLYERLDRARAFLRDHRDRAVTLADIASVVGLSPFHLARYFKLAFGTAPIAYHRALRLAYAADLLTRGASVAMAAEATGYSDATALSHAFRKAFGLSPLQYLAQASAG